MACGYRIISIMVYGYLLLPCKPNQNRVGRTENFLFIKTNKETTGTGYDHFFIQDFANISKYRKTKSIKSFFILEVIISLDIWLIGNFIW